VYRVEGLGFRVQGLRYVSGFRDEGFCGEGFRV